MARLSTTNCLLFPIVSIIFVSLAEIALTEPTLSYLNVTLPWALDGSSVIYNGDDSIYIIGGYNGTEFCKKEILQFSISTEEFILVGETPKPACFGQAIWDQSSESIYYFAQDSYESQLPNISSMVLKFQLKTLEVEEVGSINGRGNPFSAILDQNRDVVYIVGGSSGIGYNSDKEILEYDLKTNSYIKIGELPDTSLYSPLSISFIDSIGMVLILGESSIYRFIPHSTCGSSMEALNINLPTNVIRGSITYSPESQLAYIVGGSDNGNYDLLEFNPLTLGARSLKFPEFSQGLVDAGSVWVEKLNSIYFFGGFALSTGEYLSRIGVLKF